uniref:Uncharacterized protein n=1 Tax=Tetranychus urticae TaxID=32264 RepID=T1JSD3_TETUR
MDDELTLRDYGDFIMDYINYPICQNCGDNTNSKFIMEGFIYLCEKCYDELNANQSISLDLTTHVLPVIEFENPPIMLSISSL